MQSRSMSTFIIAAVKTCLPSAVLLHSDAVGLLISLIPRLLPSFLSVCDKKAGEEPGNEATC